MRNLYFIICFLAIPTLLFSQDTISVDQAYKPREIRQHKNVEKSLTPGQSFLSIGYMPLNYYRFTNSFTDGDNMMGYLGFNLGWALCHTKGHFLNFSLGYDEMSKDNMIVGNNVDNIDIFSIFNSDMYINQPYVLGKDFANFYIAITENIAYDNLIISYGLAYAYTSYRFLYDYSDRFDNSYWQNGKRETIESVYASIDPMFAVKYYFFKNFGVELQFKFAGLEFKTRSQDRDSQFSINLGFNYRIPLQKTKIEFRNGSYYEVD